uniref:Casein kinase II subunit beta n=1 Tax=Parastrongyloides trichosuri TaxID=131310 RepID=A0A0N4ZNP3_PARTI
MDSLKYNFVEEHLSKKSNKWLVKVPDEFFIDQFNLIGIHDILGTRSLEKALSLIVNDYDNIDIKDFTSISKNAVFLYGLAHARYITTPEGLNSVKKKFINNEFGNCLKISCFKQSMLPIGIYDKPSHEKVKSFCPKCQDIYHPELDSDSEDDENETNSDDSSEDSFYMIEEDFCDGAFFGTGFPEFFFFHYPYLRPK